MAYGEIKITISKRQSDARSFVSRQYYKLPLQVLPEFYNEDDDSAYLYLLNPSGGMLSNDEFYIQIDVDDYAKTNISTTSVNKVYHSKNSETAVQKTVINIGANAQLEYIPDGIIPFRGSRYRQYNNIKIKESSKMIFSDVFTAGRVSQDEIFEFTEFYSNTKITCENEIILQDIINIKPIKDEYANLLVMNGNYFISTIYLYSKEMDVENIIDQIRAVSMNEVQCGTSSPSEGLVVIKMLSKHFYAIEEANSQIFEIVRPSMLGKKKAPKRK